MLTLVDDGDQATKDAVLATLLDLFQAGHQLAGRTLLQAMLPSLASLPNTCRLPHEARSYEDRLQLVLTTFWSVASRRRTSPLSHRVAATLLLDTLHGLTAHLRHPQHTWEDQVLTVPEVEVSNPTVDGLLPHGVGGYPDQVAPMSSQDGPGPGLHELLTWATTTAIITTETANLIAEVQFSPSISQGFDRVADTHQITRAAAARRYQRAQRQLVDAVRAELGLGALLAADDIPAAS